MGCKTSGGCLFCNDRSGDFGAMGTCSTTTIFLRKMGRVRSGGPHATSRPSRRRDLEPWAPAPQQPKPCGRWVARRPGDVCSATTEAERRPWTMGACPATTEALRKMGCKTSGGRLLCNDRSGAETLDPWGQGPLPLLKLKRAKP